MQAPPAHPMPTAPCPSLHTTLCHLPTMQGAAGAVPGDALWALSSGQDPGTQHTPPAMFPSLQSSKARAGLDANTNTTLHWGFWMSRGWRDNSSTESPCCWSTKPWDRARAQERKLACRDSDATCKGFVVGSGLAVESARSI